MGKLKVVNREANLVAIAGAVIAKNLHKPTRRKGLPTIRLTGHFRKGSIATVLPDLY
jgi:hypothetical protein